MIHDTLGWKRADFAVRIAIVHDWLTGYRGGEKCLEVLCRRFPEAPLFTLFHVPGAVPAVIEKRPLAVSPLGRLPGVRHYYRGLLPLLPWGVERLQIPSDVDLVVSFSHAVAGRVRVPRGVPHVCYCFTPMRYAWHLREEYLRRDAGPVRRVFHRAAGALLNRLAMWDRCTSQRVTRFVACSQAVSQRIADCYQRGSEVIYPPVDTEFFCPGNVPRGDEYLFTSALVPYKRLDLAIEATRRLGRRLVVIGSGPGRRRFAHGDVRHVRFLGRVDDKTLRYWLRRCRALLFPGREDFGIVPLEAQACGTPVIALARDGALETVLPATTLTAGTGVLFHEPTTAALAASIEAFERGDLRIDAMLARKHAERFSRGRFERELIDYLERVLAEHRSRPNEVPTPAGRGTWPRADHVVRSISVKRPSVDAD